jgi:hypothetical protein
MISILTKMLNALTLVVLIAPFLVAAFHVPRSHSLVGTKAKVNVPRTLRDGGSDLAARQQCDVDCTNGGCCEGECWYVPPSIFYYAEVLTEIKVVSDVVP